MSWATIILAVLNLAQMLLGRANAAELRKQGADAEIAKQAMAILKMTETGKQLLAKIEAMPESELDEWLKLLGRDE